MERLPKATALALAGALALASPTPSSGTGDAPAGPAANGERLLDRLVGDWTMTGHVRNEPVTYRLTAKRVLEARYVELHMIDAATPPGYEARVFLGMDPAHGVLIAHWLDSFGAGYSIPHGTGAATSDTLRFEIPYAGGPFRDAFAWRAADGTWDFAIHAADSTGGWSEFARYTLRRTKTPRR